MLENLTWLATEMKRLNLSVLEYAEPNEAILLKATSQMAKVLESTPQINQTTPRTVVRSPSIGFFRGSHPGSSAPPLKVGDTLKLNAIVGYLDNSIGLELIRSSIEGTIDQMFAKDGDLVGYGAPLFRCVVNSN